MPYPRFTNIIINQFISQNKSISMRNMINLHTTRDDSLLGTLKYVSKTKEHQVYGALIPKEMLNEYIPNSTAYKTYYAYASGAKEPKKARKCKKPASPKQKTIPVSPKEPTKKPAKKLELAKKAKASTKGKKSKGIGILSDVALTEATHLKEVPDEQQRKISGTDEGTGTKPGVPDIPKYDFESKKESRVDDSEDESDDDNNDDDGDYNDDEDKNDDDDKADSDRTESDRNVNVNLRKEDVEMTNDNQGGADQHNVSQDSGFEQVEEDAHVTLTAVHDTQKTEGPMQSSSVTSDFIDKLLNFENTSPADNEIASLMDTTVRHEEPSSQTSSIFTVPITVISEITYALTTTIPPPPLSFNPLLQQATPTPTLLTSEAITSFPALPYFSSLFRFKESVTNLEKYLSKMKQVDQYAQAISSIHAIVDCYIGNKQG
ncbi:hypothetical protein Tco_0621532 [Tanacetum coccineum]